MEKTLYSFDGKHFKPERVDLKDIQVYKEGSAFFLKLIYEVEDATGVYEVIFPKVYPGIYTDQIPSFEYNETFPQSLSRDGYSTRVWKGTLHLDNGIDMEFFPASGTVKNKDEELINYKNVFIVQNMIKEKVHTMTLSEVEKKLGYKIKLVSEKG